MVVLSTHIGDCVDQSSDDVIIVPLDVTSPSCDNNTSRDPQPVFAHHNMSHDSDILSMSHDVIGNSDNPCNTSVDTTIIISSTAMNRGASHAKNVCYPSKITDMTEKRKRKKWQTHHSTYYHPMEIECEGQQASCTIASD